MKEKTLQDIGLTSNEAKIYLALLKSGSSLVSKIVKETRITRTHIYDRLNKLLEKGIVSYNIQSGKKYFKAVSPEKLLEKLEEKRDRLKAIMPELLATEKKEEIDIQIYKSKEGLKTLLQDILKEKKDVFILGFTGSVSKEIKYSYPHYQNKRIKLGIGRKILADHKMKSSSIIKQPLTEVRFIPKRYQNPSGMWLYGNKTVIFLPEEELYMILIKSKKVSRMYQNYFDLLWRTAKKRRGQNS